MMYGGTFIKDDQPSFFIIGLLIIVCVIKPIVGGLCYFNNSWIQQEKTIPLYFGISTTLYSLMFFMMFYDLLSNDALLKMLFGIVGFIFVGGGVLLYRYGVYIGKYKNKSGKPNYALIGTITIVGGIIFNKFIDSQTLDIQKFTVETIALIMAYIFGLGGILLIEYFIFPKIIRR